MRKSISVDELSIGMHVVGLDKSWLQTPFLVHSMTIQNGYQIEQLRAAGVRHVEIELGEEQPSFPDPLGAAQTMDLHEVASPKPRGAREEDPSAPERAFEEELPLARRAYGDATAIVRLAMRDVRMGKTLRAEPVAEVVTSLMDSVLRNRDALLSLTRLKSFDEYTFFHSVNTAVLALGLAQKLDIDREALLQLGTGALLHDIGKMKVPSRILNKPARLAAEEFEVMKQHALRGAEILQRTTGLSEEVIKPALEHHERVDGTGYPFQRRRDELSRFGMIASIVDIYDAVTSDRVYHTAMTPHRALQLVFGLAQQGHLDHALAEHFVQCIGVYPVGSCVALEGGEVGIVKQNHRGMPLSPVLVLIRDSQRQRLRVPRILNLAEQDGAPRRIAEVLDPGPLGIDSNACLDAVPA